MTTPAPPGNTGGFLGGVSGTLGGTNSLQSSIDQLNNSINSLASRIGSMNLGGGTATAQQTGPNGTQPFPRMQNPFQVNQRQTGIGGGGPGGAGNVSQPRSFGRYGMQNMSGSMMMLRGLASFGQNMMQNQLSLNQYATMSMTGLNYNGMSQNQAMRALYSQAGAMPGNLNALGFSPQDMYGAMPYLQQLGGTQLIGQSSLGRAGFGAMQSFGVSNPGLSATTSAQLAAAMYSPQFSMQMMMMGYNPIRSMTGGAPMNAGQAAQSILKGMGLGGMNSARVFGNLASPKGQVALQALFGSSGISNQQASQYLDMYSQLFSKGLSPTAATNLINRATTGSVSSMKAAQATLANKYGIRTSSNDLQQLKNAQSVISGRQGEYAGGFNDAINQSTSLLEQFNSALNKLLNGPLGTAGGYAGGMGGMASGIMGGAGIGMGLGGVRILSRLLGLGGAGGSLLGAGGGAAAAGEGAGVAAAIAPIAAAAAPVIAGVLLGAVAKAVSDTLSPAGTKRGVASKVMQQRHLLPFGMDMFSGLIADVGSKLHIAGVGGGATPVAHSSQQKTGGNNQLGGISGSAKKAVGAAESQVGVPYAWGDELPGVGFDCSGLVQWAYGQAGVHLPRTSQAMWEALKNRRIPLSKVQEGDLIFAAGSDGTTSSPGHVAMMVNHNQLIQAPYTGANVGITGFDANGWIGAARPAGNGSFVAGNTASAVSSTGAASGSSLFAGNRGMGPGTNSYGSAEEVDLIASMGSGSGGGAFGMTGGGNNNGSSGSPNTNTGAAGGGSTRLPTGKGNLVAYAKKIAQRYGWASGLQWQDFLRIVNREDASWDPTATNPASGAYGIPQALPGSKMASAGPDWRTNPETQLRWMFGYIKGTYGSPSKAWANEQSLGYYGAGGMMQPGLSIVGERGPELAMTSGGTTHIFSNAQTRYLINAIKGNVSQNPWQTDVTNGTSSSRMSTGGMNVNFNAGSIVIQMAHGSDNIASKAGREVARQIVRHINSEAVSQAIRNGEKL